MSSGTSPAAGWKRKPVSGARRAVTSSSCGTRSSGSASAALPSRKARIASRSCFGASSRQTVRQISCSDSVYSTCGIGWPGSHASAAAAISLRRARYAGSLAPGWSSARWTLTSPSASCVTGAYSCPSSNMHRFYACAGRASSWEYETFRTIATMERLGDLDRKILAMLQREGRRSFADIGREVGLSTPAVKRRVDRMEEAGVIRGYAAVVDPSRLGLGFEAIAEVYCADRTAPHDVLASVEGIPEVVSAVTVSGEPDAVLRVQVEDVRHLERLIETLRRRPNVVRTRTMIVLSVLVDRPSALPQ